MSMDDLLSEFADQQTDQLGDLSWKEIDGIPTFQHQEVLALYAWGFDIPITTIETILALPRTSLIEDLHLILEDAVQRYEAYLEKDSDSNGAPLSLGALSFPAHAMFLLAELEDEASLDVLIQFLSSDVEMLDFWMGELETVHLWPILLRLGQNDTQKLQDFVRNHEAGVFYRGIAIQAMGQLAWHYSAKKKEVLNWFEDMFEYYLENLQDDEEGELLGNAISVVSDLRAVDLLDVIEPLFKADLVDTSVCGALFEVQGDMYEPVNNWAKAKVKTIFETYLHFNETWDAYADDDDEDDAESLVKGLSGKEKKKAEAPYNPEAQPAKKAAKPGRSDLCACGSGLKYKVCHGAD